LYAPPFIGSYHKGANEVQFTVCVSEPLSFESSSLRQNAADVCDVANSCRCPVQCSTAGKLTSWQVTVSLGSCGLLYLKASHDQHSDGCIG